MVYGIRVGNISSIGLYRIVVYWVPQILVWYLQYILLCADIWNPEANFIKHDVIVIILSCSTSFNLILHLHSHSMQFLGRKAKTAVGLLYLSGNQTSNSRQIPPRQLLWSAQAQVWPLSGASCRFVAYYNTYCCFTF